MAQAIITTLTDLARTKLADMLANGRSFTVSSFVTGEGGHDVGDPNIALTPDPSVTALPSQTFGPKSITSKTLTSPYCVEFSCLLIASEAVGPLSNIGLLASINYSPIPADPLVGTTFLYAHGNLPLSIKTDSEEKTFAVSVQY